MKFERKKYGVTYLLLLYTYAANNGQFHSKFSLWDDYFYRLRFLLQLNSKSSSDCRYWPNDMKHLVLSLYVPCSHHAHIKLLGIELKFYKINANSHAVTSQQKYSFG